MTLAAVGLRRTKLQVLQPIAGVMDRPLSVAPAWGAADSRPATAPAAARETVRAATMGRRKCGRIGALLWTSELLDLGTPRGLITRRNTNRTASPSFVS